MAKDSSIEATKQTLVQRFRAWGGKYLSVSSSFKLLFHTAIDRHIYNTLLLTYYSI